MLCGDFRQILPVVPRGTNGNIVTTACVKKSYLWDHVVAKHLHTNMRVNLCGDQAARQFADQLLAIRDGKFSTDDDTDVVQLPETMDTNVCNIDDLIPRILLSNFTHIPWLLYFGSLNKTTHTINTNLVEKLPGECIQYKP